MTRPSEAQEQAAVMEWAAIMRGVFPELEWLFHNPNGGVRTARTGALLKKQGVKPGVFDLQLPAARRGYFGLFIEMKAGRNKLTDRQKVFETFVSGENYFTAVCYSADAAVGVLDWYLHGAPTRIHPQSPRETFDASKRAYQGPKGRRRVSKSKESV